MAANVETMFYTREKPWHGLGTMVKDSPSSVQALSLAGLDWKVEQHPIITTEGIPLTGFWANVRDTDKKVLSRYIYVSKDIIRGGMNMKKFEYKVMAIPTSMALGTKGYEKIAAEFEAELKSL